MDDKQLRLGRITLEDSQAPHQQVVFDLVYEGNFVKPAPFYFGIWQDKNEQSLCPFVMGPNGEVDFGSGYSGDDRMYQCNVMEVELAMGAEVDWTTDSYQTKLRVVDIQQLM
jgi:hypothetical protein